MVTAMRNAKNVLLIISILQGYIYCNTDWPSVSKCRCIPYYLCGNYNANNLNKNYATSVKEHTCEHPMHICCEKSNIRGEQVDKTKIRKRDVEMNCGKRYPYGVETDRSGVLNKSKSTLGEFPWVVAIIATKQDETNKLVEQYICGGSLLHERVVLTAGHCGSKGIGSQDGNLKVRIGEWNIRYADETFPHQERNVLNIIIHPRYKHKYYFFDVALLVLDSPVDLNNNPHINFVCLPPKNFVVTSATDKNCYSMGWGKNAYGENGQFQTTLKKVKVPIVPSKKCENTLKKTGLTSRFFLHPTFICAGGIQGVDTCTGDGGNPLVCPIENSPHHFYQVGIVSWGVKCGLSEIPGVYANVLYLRDWIDGEMNKLQFGISSYTT